MTDPQDLLRLADEVAAATGPDRDLNAAIHKAVFCIVCCRPLLAPSYTASLDAAMTLIPPDHTVQLSDWDHPILREKGPWQAIVLPLGARGAMQQFTFTNRCDHAATAAAALTAAALRARAHSTKESDNG